MTNFNTTIQIILAALQGERDALIKLKQVNDRLEGEAAALRGNLLNLCIENLDALVIKPMEELRWR